MKTPAEIAEAQNKATTRENADALAEALQTICAGSDKDFYKLMEELENDGQKPERIVQGMLASAYDWFRYGN